MATKSQAAPIYLDHELPMLRVHRALDRAGQIAQEKGVDGSVAHEIATEVIAIIGAGTQRVGHLCTTCRSQIEWTDGRPHCPQRHALLGLDLGCVPLTILISFDPIVYES